MSATRQARFAGSWYPGDVETLSETLAAATPAVAERVAAKAVIVPHAGYRYSLGVAAETYARVEIPRVAVVLCPNHTVPPGIVSIWPDGSWETPLGEIPIDVALTQAIQRECPFVEAETGAHLREHAIELHLPILQHHQPDLRLVAIVVAAPSFPRLQKLGEGIARAVAGRDDVLLVASTDMTHFESGEVARAQDERALAKVTDMDPQGLLDLCTQEHITMCGVRPTSAVLVAAKQLGATQPSWFATPTRGT